MGRVHSVARFKIHPGKTEEFKRLSANCMALAKAYDSGTIRYDIFLNDNEPEAVVYEEFESSEAALLHFANMGETQMPSSRSSTWKAKPGASPLGNIAGPSRSTASRY